MARVAETVVRERKKRKWSQEDLARASRLSLSTIRRIENGDESSNYTTLAAVARALELPFDDDRGEFVVEEPEFPDSRKGPGVPMVGDLNGGILGETIHAQHISGDNELPLPLEWFPGCIAARVRGSSMRPKYDDGDWVILRLMECTDVETGFECYFELTGQDNGGTLKKAVVVDAETLMLLPINDGEHAPIRVVCADVRSVRRAVGKYVPFVQNFGFDMRACKSR